MGELMQIIDKNIQYTDYITDHISNVRKIYLNMAMGLGAASKCKKYIQEILEECDITLLDVYTNQIIIHDQSKYSSSEFDAYRKNFFPINDEEKRNNKAEFDLAWKHHKGHNPHHWEHWYERGIKKAMPANYVIEMLCDHIAICMNFGNTAIDYFNKNKDNIYIGEKQEEIYLKLANLYYDVYNVKGIIKCQ